MAADNWAPVHPDELRVGHYIKINHRWFDHPFVRKIFRITSEEEIQVIRNAGLTRLFVDHGKSEAASEPSPAQPVPEPLTVRRERGRQKAERKAAQLLDAKVAHVAQVQEQRESLALVHSRYKATVERAHTLLAMLRAMDPASSSAIDEFVTGTMELLASGSAPLALVATAAPLNAAQRIALQGSDAVSLAGTIGKRMGLSTEQLRTLTTAAALHVVGLQQLPAHLAGETPDAHFRMSEDFRQYPRLGAQQLAECGGFSADVLRIVREHRERPDGRGFPDGIAGEDIHPLALILGAIREFQVQCAAEHATPAQALAHMYKNLRVVFGDEIINHLIASMTVYPPGTYVLLSDGSIGRVLRVNEGNRLRPVIGLFDESTSLQEAEILDLSQEQDLSIQRFVDVTLLPRRLVEQVKNTWAGVALAPPAPRDERAA